MRLLRGFRLRAGVVVVAMVVLVGVAVTDVSVAAAGRQTYLQLNMCGNACNAGGLAVVRNLRDSITTARPVAVTLNEVCENQFDWLRGDLPGYRGRFDPTGPTCVNGAHYGNAILVRAPEVELVGSWPLPSPTGGEPRRLMCLRANPPHTGALVVCGTHISYAAADIGPQVAAVSRIVQPLEAPGPDGVQPAVLLGGDFNSMPTDSRLNPMYGACYASGTGTFEEAGAAGCTSRSTGTATFGNRKIDYIFLSPDRWSGVHAEAYDAVSGLSDHKGLWATATPVS
ncbi:MAG: endonuclease/exonuclease/phosphatase family protein [Micromonosporaceae bacterium]|nr:endonuclease/exonuclease/phosphatase family protein [Micromonosporaceae bacterium]